MGDLFIIRIPLVTFGRVTKGYRQIKQGVITASDKDVDLIGTDGHTQIGTVRMTETESGIDMIICIADREKTYNLERLINNGRATILKDPDKDVYRVSGRSM